MLSFIEAEIAQQYLIKTDLLSYVNGDELQQVLDVFIREVRRPTGETYLPESIYYLCLGTSNLFNDSFVDLVIVFLQVFNIISI